MKIVSRYITSLYLYILGVCVASFVAIYLVIDFLEKFGRFSRDGGKLQDMALFFVWKIPDITCQIVPLAVLMATLLTLGVLSRNSEITAMRSCGISLVWISAPILATAFAISLLTLAAEELVVPQSFVKMKYIENVLIRKKSPNTFFRQNNIWFRDENAILQARLFDPSTMTLKGITLWKTGADMMPVQRIEAEQGVLKGGGWLFKNAVVRDIGGGNITRTITVAEMPLELNLKADDLKVVDKYADSMGIRELRRYNAQLEAGGYDATSYRAQMHSKVSLPFASLIMAFLGIPFALRGGRTSGIALGIGVSLGIGFGYFIINAVILSFGQAGVLPPMVSAWAANVLFAASGIWLAMTINR